jgi:transcriptional regulator with XRE-family HTH domain
MNDAWRWRLRDAIDQTGRTHTAVAEAAGIAPETLSRILNHEHSRPWLHTIVRLAREAGVTVGWVLGEQGFEVGPSERDELRHAAQLILDLTKNRNEGS